jgi:hypothetical protein
MRISAAIQLNLLRKWLGRHQCIDRTDLRRRGQRRGTGLIAHEIGGLDSQQNR